MWLPRNAPWIDEFLRELLSFPAGKNDDQVDTLSLLGRMLGEMITGKGPPKPDRIPYGPQQMPAVTYSDIEQLHNQNQARRR